MEKLINQKRLVQYRNLLEVGQTRRKFLESLNKQERNIVLIGDLALEFDPFTYVLLYSFPQQAHNYPAIAQALPHLLPATPNQSPPHSPPPSPNSSGGGDFFTPPTTPNQNLPTTTNIVKLIDGY